MNRIITGSLLVHSEREWGRGEGERRRGRGEGGKERGGGGRRERRRGRGGRGSMHNDVGTQLATPHMVDQRPVY